jgi:CxxC motif-containing protein
MMDKHELICIVCPLGCKMQVWKPSTGGKIQVRGHQCARGKEYAIEETTSPTRMVTSTVVIKNAALPRLPVKTSRPIPKELIPACMEALKHVVVTAPVTIGDVIIGNLLNTGIDIVATRSMR